ncbi:leucyl aminopeptidase family protein [Flavobacterium sp. SM2513]|uniref:leucyl aminopeptidase family protein n=1 Tax=Flavobacterium sp. SM2513 TaxID=3424766 RepID=UPI003D7F446A
MYINNYLNTTLTSYSEASSIKEESVSVLICFNESHAKQFEPRPLVADKVRTALESKKASVLSFFAEKQYLVVANTSDETENWRMAGAQLYKKFRNEKIAAAHLVGFSDLKSELKAAFLEGLLLSSYKFTKYKKEDKTEVTTVLISDTAISKEALSAITTVVEAVSLAKTMVNEPVNFLDSVMFGNVVVEAGKKHGFETEILQKKDIEAFKMGGLLAVNQGSTVPPTFNIMKYKPSNAINTKPLVLVGKGVTFDTGGYSLKVGGSMPGMKSDMGGGAAVVGIISAIAKNNLPYHVIGLVPATDNKVSGNALVVDDVITMMDGTTVEVLNTDAEGRLVLADALTYAKRFDPELVIDMATLTGASVAITGPFGIAMAGNNQEQMDALKVSGETTYERLIQLPFWKEFEDLLKSDIADLKNIGGPVGGATTAGKFLEHFTDYPWIHLDIAGAAFIKDANGYKQSGGTGVAVRLIYDFVKERIAAQ